MKVLAIGRPREGAAAPGGIARHARDEMRKLWELYAGGTVREMYLPGSGPGSVLVLEAASKQEAAEILAGLPLVAAGLIQFEVIELHPFGALGMLFAGREGTG